MNTLITDKYIRIKIEFKLSLLLFTIVIIYSIIIIINVIIFGNQIIGLLYLIIFLVFSFVLLYSFIDSNSLCIYSFPSSINGCR